MFQTARLPDDHPPVLVLVVDTEEEFHWGQPFDRNATSVTAMAEIGRFQDICDDLGVRPCYVVDYPVCDQPAGYEPLLPAVEAGRCEIGAHLHPWVNPPFVEEVNARNSYPGNLPREIERDKLAALKQRLTETFGQAPVTYKAGRYGIGPNSPGILAELDFKVDLSPAPGFDYRRDGGPDFTKHAAHPHWVGADASILSLPTTGGFTGWLPAGIAAAAHAAGDKGVLSTLKLRGILSRLDLARQGRLSPEGYDLAENKRLAATMLKAGNDVLSYSFHSPSLKPGCTSYTRSAEDLARFVSDIRAFVEFFVEDLGGTVMTPSDLLGLLSRNSGLGRPDRKQRELMATGLTESR